MGRRKKYHIPNFEKLLQKYADERSLDLSQYTEYHYRLTDGGYTVLDAWDTGRYYILLTSYNEIALGEIERQGEGGDIPMHELETFMDKIFFPEKEDT